MAALLTVPAGERLTALLVKRNSQRSIAYMTGMARITVAYKKRRRIDRIFSKFKHFRRIATRYYKLDHSFDSFICLQVITLYLSW